MEVPDISRLDLAPNLHNIPTELILDIFSEDTLSKRDLYNTRLVHRSLSNVLRSRVFERVQFRWGTQHGASNASPSWLSSPSILFTSGRTDQEEIDRLREFFADPQIVENFRSVRHLSLKVRGGNGPRSCGFPTPRFGYFVEVFRELGLENFPCLNSIAIDISLKSTSVRQSFTGLLQQLACYDRELDLDLKISHYDDIDEGELSEEGRSCLEWIPLCALRRLAITADHKFDDDEGSEAPESLRRLPTREDPDSDSVPLLSVETFHGETFRALSYILQNAPRLAHMKVRSKRYLDSASGKPSSYRWDLLDSVLDAIEPDVPLSLESLKHTDTFGSISQPNMEKLSALKSIVMREPGTLCSSRFGSKSHVLLSSENAVESLRIPFVDENVMEYIQLPVVTEKLKYLEINLQIPFRDGTYHSSLATEFYHSALPGLQETLTDLTIRPLLVANQIYHSWDWWLEVERSIWRWSMKTAKSEGVDWSACAKLSTISGFVLGNQPFAVGISSFFGCNSLKFIKMQQILKWENITKRDWMGCIDGWTAEEDGLLPEGLRLEIESRGVGELSISEQTKQYTYRNRRFHEVN